MAQDFPNLDGIKELSIDVETRDEGLKERGPGWAFIDAGYVTSIAIGTADTEFHFPINCREGLNYPEENVVKYINALRPDLWIGANIGYDLGWLDKHGITLVGKLFDNCFAECLLDEYDLSYSLETMLKKHKLNPKSDAEMIKLLASSFPKEKNLKSKIWTLSVDEVDPYIRGDVRGSFDLFKVQQPLLTEQGLDFVFELECSLIRLWNQIRKNGMRVDLERAQAVYDELSTRIAAANPDSIRIFAAADLATLAYKRKLDFGQTPTGKPSFTKAWLKQNMPDIFDLRRLTKLRDTFVKGVVLEKHEAGLIHAQIHPMRADENGTRHGRTSCTNPNLQQISARDPEAEKLVRGLFIPNTAGEKLVSIDASQIEYRFLAHYATGAGSIRDEYNKNPDTDFHQKCAQLTGADRDLAKTINFLVVYGGGAQKLAGTLQTPLDHAKDLLEKYHTAAPFLREFSNHAAQVASSRGYIKTFGGRRCRFPFFEPRGFVPKSDRETPLLRAAAVAKWGTKPLQRAGTYMALNRLLQGSAAILHKLQLQKLMEAGYGKYIIMCIHDEMIFSVPQDFDTKPVLDLISNIEGFDRVPLLMNSCEGPTWGEMR